MEFEGVIGLEIHVQLKTKSKLFCSCPVDLKAPPNKNICPICTGHPGVLPVLNRQAIVLAVRAALLMNMNISRRSVFARKNYTYPDLPKNYQISQYEEPLAVDGYLEVNGKKIGIQRMHLEEDAGKLVHTGAKSYVDFTRSGVPLLEIVTKPDIGTPEEAYEFLRKLHKILVWCDVTEGSMEEGNLRCDVNVSVRPKCSEVLGTKVELKNINSFKFIKEALEYEIKRQSAVIAEGGRVIQETRLFDPTSGKTFTMRRKEETEDYRYFPEPDLLILDIPDDIFKEAERGIIELPDERAKRFMDADVSEYASKTLTQSKKIADFFEECLNNYEKPQAIANFILEEVLRAVNEMEKELEDIPKETVIKVLKMQDEGKLTRNLAKQVFRESLRTGESIEKIIERLGGEAISDDEAIEKAVEEVLKEFPKEVEEYRKGKEKLFGFFMGEVMKKLKRRGDPRKVRENLAKKLT